MIEPDLEELTLSAPWYFQCTEFKLAVLRKFKCKPSLVWCYFEWWSSPSSACACLLVVHALCPGSGQGGIWLFRLTWWEISQFYFNSFFSHASILNCSTIVCILRNGFLMFNVDSKRWTICQAIYIPDPRDIKMKNSICPKKAHRIQSLPHFFLGNHLLPLGTFWLGWKIRCSALLYQRSMHMK